MTPKVSICLPTYNRARSLEKTIRAMQAQTVQEWELIVGNDASTDNTEEVVRSFADGRIRYVAHPKNVGIYANWNALVELARGEYVCIYHDHDLYAPTILERSCALLDANPNVIFVHTAVVLIDEECRPIYPVIQDFPESISGAEFQRHELYWSVVTAATAIVRRSAYAQAGLYRTEYGLCADAELWMRLAKLGDVGYVRQPQALIVARDPADALRAMCDELPAFYRIRREYGDVLPSKRGIRGWYNKLALYLKFQFRLARALLKGAVAADDTTALALANVIGGMGSPPIRALAGLYSRMNPLRKLIRRLGGPLEERRSISFQQAAAIACENDPVLRGLL